MGIAVADLPAQRYLTGMRGMQLTAGSVGGLNLKKGFHAGVALSQYTKRADRWIIGFEYLERRHPYSDLLIPQSQFTVDAGYYLKFLSDARKTFFVSAGASLLAGYETVNRNNPLLPDGATVKHGDAFLFGAVLTLETEIYLVDRIVLLCNVRERLMTGSSVGKLNTQFGLGVKYIIN